MSVKAFLWKNSHLAVLDQRLLPNQIKFIQCKNHRDVVGVIRDMAVRGAPAIGCVAAYGMVLAAKNHVNLKKAAKELKAARPTAVNLAWAVDRMFSASFPRRRESTISNKKTGSPTGTFGDDGIGNFEREAQKIEREDIANNKRMGDFGAKLFKKNAVVVTHCNAGSLATAGYGTSLGVVRALRKNRKLKNVLVNETRPYLQGARLTAWELAQEKIPHQLITDNMDAYFMQNEKISGILVGCDRVAANGDVANKIGTYGVAIMAKYHNVPFYVAMPTSTLDITKPTGKQIPIEERSSEEVVQIGKKRIAPKKTKARHPGFDITPASLITAIITEYGVIRPPYKRNLKKLFKKL